MTISSLGQMSMRFDPVNGMASPRRMLKKIRMLKGRPSRKPTANEVAKKQTPKKKKLRRRSILAAAKQVAVTNRIKKMQLKKKIIGKKKDMNLLQDLDMFKEVMKSIGEAQDDGGWAMSPINRRVSTSEAHGTIDSKSLNKAADPEEETLIQDVVQKVKLSRSS